jgi:hypothetical protein
MGELRGLTIFTELLPVQLVSTRNHANEIKSEEQILTNMNPADGFM